MRILATIATIAVAGCVTVSVANAACQGSLGRGWGGGKGAGQFTMSAADGSCRVGFPNFIDDKRKTSTPATQTTVTRAPKSGKTSIGARGVVYTPSKGFKGKDTFCTRNTSPKVKGTLAGCVTVTVR